MHGKIQQWKTKSASSRYVAAAAAAAAKSLQLCPTLCNPIYGSPPESPIRGILQARTLEWVAIAFSNAWKWKVKVKSLSCVQLLATPWTAAYQAPPSTGFSRQEYWSGVPSPSPQDMWHLFSIFLLRRNLDWMSHKSSYSSKILHGSELYGFQVIQKREEI